MNTATHGYPPYEHEAIMSPYFPAIEYRPVMVGPYECKMVGELAHVAVDGADQGVVTHMRWWDGEKWSLPLQDWDMTIDGEWMIPEATYFIVTDVEESYARFEWRGFNEDQEPL